MNKKNSVFIAASLDGYITDKNGGLAWLNSIPNPDNISTGFEEFMENTDALIMGKKTFETVIGFDVPWPYTKPVYVLSNSLKTIPEALKNKVFIVKGELKSIINELHNKGLYSLYIDGGKTIQNFLKEDLIDEIIISTFPILLGGGTSLFGELTKELQFELVNSKTFFNQLVQNHYKRKIK